MTRLPDVAASPDFLFERLAAGEPVMRGPGFRVAFERASGLRHAIEFVDPRGSAGTLESTQSGPRFVSVASARGFEPADTARAGNPIYQDVVPHALPEDGRSGVC